MHHHHLTTCRWPPRIRTPAARSPDAYLGASSVQQRLENLYGASKAWRDSFAKDAQRSQCSAAAGSLCASHGQTVEQAAQLLMATSPRAFDARSSSQNGGFSAVGPPKDQGGCSACEAAQGQFYFLLLRARTHSLR